MIPPNWILSEYARLYRPSSSMLDVLRKDSERREARRRQLEREQPLWTKARRRARNGWRKVHRRINGAREVIALFIAPWLEPEDY